MQDALDENKRLAAADAAAPPKACPYDGTPLQRHPTNGSLNCPHGDYRWPA